MDSRRESTNRNIIIDALNGTGIFFVVLGHYTYQMEECQAWYDWIYSFHMPLFFIVGGCLIAIHEKRYLSQGIVQYCIHQAKRILIPYYAFILLSFSVHGMLMPFVHNDFGRFTKNNMQRLLMALIFGGGYLKDNELLDNLPLWFLPLYFVAKIFFVILLRMKQNHRKAFTITFMIIFLTVLPFQNMAVEKISYSVNVLPVALVFMLMGYLYYGIAPKVEALLSIINNDSKILITVILFSLGMATAYFFPAQVGDIKNYIYILGAAATCYAFYMLYKSHCPYLFVYWGRNSIWILGLHGLVIGFFRNFVQSHVFPDWSGAFLYAVDSMIIMLVLTLFIGAINCAISWMKSLLQTFCGDSGDKK